ncbi:hypothetical protein BIV25_45470 [Streptomyces sp. MUSC 14]|uniref:hypothetical protein n=1 Tax=Streptomyces sp. MUSC 14 TaxID=1354889 RepID=UPI0008F5D808|nr:hypothetical protein [Streptomyces sp. MUSC 14]OIJ84935.1 hypothetical protein BIV25_45470 [Streptomyces sp. MUSC 14]
MTRTVFTDKVFPHTKLIGSPRSLGSADLVRCTVQGGTLAQYEDPEFGLRVHDLSLRDCRAGGVLHGVQFSDVSVHNLASGGRILPSACVFRHVTLSGRIPQLMVRPAHYSLPEAVQEAFRDGAERFYAEVDWALDIAAAKFSDAEFSGIPGHLVRRDPETQFLLHRDRAETADSQAFSPRARSYLAKARTSSYPTVVVVAPTRSKYFKDVLKDLASLRAVGIAE